MSLSIPKSPQKETQDIVDLFRVQKEADRLSAQLLAMKDERAAAAHIIEYDSSRRKQALSIAVMAAFKAGAESTGKAEHMAQASPAYEANLTQLGREYAAAEQVRMQADGLKDRLKILQSIMSNERKALDL